VTETTLDEYALLMTEVKDALPAPKTNLTQANNDYRALQPCEVHRSQREPYPGRLRRLGLVVGTAVMGWMRGQSGGGLAGRFCG